VQTGKVLTRTKTRRHVLTNQGGTEITAAVCLAAFGYRQRARTAIHLIPILTPTARCASDTMTKLLGILVFVLTMIGPIGVGLVIAVPIAGAIVRSVPVISFVVRLS
jgi:hypothetical protein